MQYHQDTARKQEEFGMTRSLRSRMLGAVLILAATLTVSATLQPPEPTWPRGPDDLWVWFTSRPPREACSNGTYSVFVFYWRGYNLRPVLTPLTPDGELTTTASSGSLDPDTPRHVSNNGAVWYIYTPGKAETVTLNTNLTYPGGQSAKSTTSFKVVECQTVKFELEAKAEVREGDDVVKSSASGEGELTFGETTISGEFQLDVQYSIEPDNKAVSCNVTPAKGYGTVKVTGEIKKDFLGNKYFELKMVYPIVKNFVKGNVVCYDKISKKKTDKYDIMVPKGVDTSKDLEKILTYGEGETRKAGTFGPDGTSKYTLHYNW
jgi:hypothetical protein